MLRSALYLVAFSLVVTPVACKKKKDDASDKTSASAKDDEGGKKKSKASDDEHEEESAGDDKPKGKPSKGCKLDTHVKADVTITSECKVKVKDIVWVEEGATLTIEPGAKLLFEANAGILVSYGKLVAKGDEDKPILFTSSNSSASAGDWQGIIYGEKASAGNVLDHVTIEYAGHDGGYAHAAISMYGSPSEKRISITNSTFQHNAHAGIHNDSPKTRFAKVEGNTFQENGGAAMVLDADVIGSVGQNKLDEPIKVQHGTVTTSATWPKAPAYVVEDSFEIAGKGSAAVLTLPEKTTVKVTAGHHIMIGNGDGGGLIAKGVTFTSANEHPAEGDWHGLVFASKAVNTTLEDCILEYAGQASGGYGQGAISFYGGEPAKMKGVKIKNCTFRHNEHASIDPRGHECGDLEANNKFEDKTHCLKDH